jgi:CAP12/Pycsar effector protein, TIR domain
MSKASVFVGSSTEGIEVARAIGFQLQDTAEVTIWNEGVFRPSEGSLESLVNSLDRFDFSIFVFTPDDTVVGRGDAALAPRDNVMFELGLFLGRLGKSRTFVVRSSQPIKIASDLLGITVLRYDADRTDRNLRAAVSAACVPIREAIRDLGRLDARGLEEITRTSSQLQSDVESAVALLARARAFETELFLKYQGGRFIQREEADRLKEDIQQLMDVAKRFRPPETK